MGRLDHGQREGIRAALVALAVRDPRQLAGALRRLSGPGGADDPAGGGGGLAHALAPVLAGLGPVTPVDAGLFVAVTRVLQDFGLALAPVVLGAVRALATVQVTVERLAPDLDLLAEAAAATHELVAAPA